MSSSGSQSSGSSTSSSTPGILPFLQQLAQFSQGLAEQTYNWASGEFQKTSALTDQNVQSYLSTSAAALSQAQRDTSRYNNLFQPQENNLVADANSYASAPRIAAEMGSAEAGVGQAMDAGRQNAERDLQAFGIDPSSGRYAELEQAGQAQKAAAQAGAGQQARLSTEATGRALRSEAIQVGERYPGQVINSLNTAMQGFSGAENARLANANTGVALKDAAAPYIKFPPVSNTSEGRSGQVSQSGSNNPGGQGSGKSPTGNGSTAGKQNSNNGNSGGFTGAGAGPVIPSFKNGVAPDPQQTFGADNNYNVDGSANPLYDPSNPGSITDMSGFNDTSGSAMPGGGDNFQGDPFNVGNASGYDGSYDPSSQTSGFAGSDWGSSFDAGTPTDFGSASDYTGGDTSGTSYSDGYGGDTSSYDTSSYYGDSGGGDYSDYARGGPIQSPGQFAGHVSPGMSPSRGAQVDDVPMPIGGGSGGGAHLNAGEFVIPDDVAKWKGQEFFQKLIMQSRKARSGAPAKPTKSGGDTSAYCGGAI